MREPWMEYWDIMELPIGEIPYISIDRAFKDEKYLRKFTPTYAKKDMLDGYLSALLYWYPYYIDQLYELSLEGVDYRRYFDGTNFIEDFEYLFPQISNRLDKLRTKNIKTNHLGEIKL